MKTTNAALQACLDNWHAAANNALTSSKLLDIIAFVDTFAPFDVNKEDKVLYARSLLEDREYFEATVRDIGDCAR